eukprot:SAG11_NODE_4897_length_1731_cov_1.602941_1_plen_66_part_10
MIAGPLSKSPALPDWDSLESSTSRDIMGRSPQLSQSVAMLSPGAGLANCMNSGFSETSEISASIRN